MTVYVDDMRARFGRMIMCHMIAETEAELHHMAFRIGVSRFWYQGNHYDVCLAKRALAVRYGAKEITMRQCALMVACHTRDGVMPDPDCAADRFRSLLARIKADQAMTREARP